MMMELELRGYLHVFKKRAHWIILIVIFFMLISSFLSIYVFKPKYQSMATLLVDKPQIYDENSIITYKEIILSASVLNAVIRNLGLDMTYEKMKKKIDVVVVKNTKIIKIIVHDQDVKDAVRIANEIARTSMHHINRITMDQSIRILDRAEISIKKVKPIPAFYIPIASIIGLFIGIFAASFLEYLDNRFKSTMDIEKYLGIPVIGIFLKSYPGRSRAGYKNRKTIFLCTEPESPRSESYRELRTNLQFLISQQNLRSIIITSSALGEGKSDIAVNLAAAIAKVGEKVLLIDANLRNPECHEYFGMNNAQGIIDILLGDRAFEERIYPTKIENLDLLPAGERFEGFAELLSSKKMAEIMEIAKTKYDRILLDSSPVGWVTDAAILSALCDGILFVCEMERIPIWKICKAKDALDKVCGNIIGVVVNRISICKENIFYYH